MSGQLDLSFSHQGGPGVGELPVVVDAVDAKLETAAQPRSVRLASGWQQNLEPGTYLVRVRFPSGEEIRRTCTVRDGDRIPISVDMRGMAGHQSLRRSAALRPLVRDESTPGLAGTSFTAAWVQSWTGNASREWQPIDFNGKTVGGDDHAIQYRFTFASQSNVLQLGGPNTAWRFVSLPAAAVVYVTVSPRRENDLAVEVTTNSAQAEALLGYLRTGAVEAADVMAESLLHHQESLDPIGAAIGGYYLLRTANLDRLSAWGPYLSSEFSWLADGAVINGWQHIHAGREHRGDPDRHFDAARQQLIQAARRGVPVYTEGLRLLVDGLRLLREDTEAEDAELDTALTFIEPFATAADWSAVTVTYSGADPAEPDPHRRYGIPENHERLVPLRPQDLIELGRPAQPGEMAADWSAAVPGPGRIDDTVSDILGAARLEAATMVAEARQQAERIIADAQDEAGRITRPMAAGADKEMPAVPTLAASPRDAKDSGRSERSLRKRLFFGDLVAISLAWGLPMLYQSQLRPDQSVAVWLAAAVSTLVVIKYAGLYRPWVYSEFSRQAARIIAATAVGGSVLAAAGLLASGGPASDTPVAPAAVGAAGAAALMIVLRWRCRRWLKHKRADGHFLQTIVLVGTNEDAAAMWQMLSDEPELGYRVGGVVGKEAQVAPWLGIPHRSELTDLPQLADEVGAEGVILVSSALNAAESAAAVRGSLACGLHVQFWPGLAGVLSSRIRTAPVSGLPMFYVEAHRPPAWHIAAKRAIDIMTAAVLLPLAAPVLLMAAIGIRLEDGGPVLYRHRVIGRYGVQTEVLKLRTMVPNAAQKLDGIAAMNERKGGPLFKSSNDPRVTRIGRLLRDTSIDELPQLWDVLTGRMSLVGPRFAMPKEAAQFDEELQRRTVMRPGITGLWQTEARDNPSFSAYRRLDLLYVDNWSLGLDLAILVNTAHSATVRAVRALLPRGGHRTERRNSGEATPRSSVFPGLRQVRHDLAAAEAPAGGRRQGGHEWG